MNYATLPPWFWPIAIFFGTIICALLMGLSWNAWVDKRRQERLDAIQRYEYPASVRQQVIVRYPHLTEVEIDLALNQLSLYYIICRKAYPKQVVMPSIVVEACWAAFENDVACYQLFCKTVFRGTLHRPMEQVNSEINFEDGAWLYRRALALTPIQREAPVNLLPEKSHIPTLFLIDEVLRIPEGFTFSPQALQTMATYETSQLDTGSDSDSGSSSSSDNGDSF